MRLDSFELSKIVGGFLCAFLVIVGFRVPYIVGPDTQRLDTKIEHLNRYAEQVIAKVG